MAQGRAFLTQLRAELNLGTTLEAVEPQRASGELAGTLVPSHEPREPGGTGTMGQQGVHPPASSVSSQCLPAFYTSLCGREGET